MDPASEAPASFEFGRFRISPRHRELLIDGRPLPLGGIGGKLTSKNGGNAGFLPCYFPFWPGKAALRHQESFPIPCATTDGLSRPGALRKFLALLGQGSDQKYGAYHAIFRPARGKPAARARARAFDGCQASQELIYGESLRRFR